jgi:Kef-type K+ transport system membrane component KefB
MLTLGLSQSFRVSGLFAGLALGIACRWLQGRTRLTRVEFGGGGDVFFVILFVFAGANLHLKEVLQYAPVALAFVGARIVAKVGVVYACGRAFGGGHRRSFGTGLLLVPMAGLAIGLVQTTSQLMPELGGRVAAITLAAVALFETIGPPIAAWALHYSGDAQRRRPESTRGLPQDDAAAEEAPRD